MNNIETKKWVLCIVAVLIALAFSEFFIHAIDNNYTIVGFSSLAILYGFSIVGIYKTLKSILL